MPKKKLHPSVTEFKEFVKRHPKLIQEVRQGKTNWQELFEEWYLLGAEDPRWDDYTVSGNYSKSSQNSAKDTTNNMAFLNNMINTVKKMDMNQVQSYIGQLHDALGTAQQLLTQFQSQAKSSNNRPQGEAQERRPNPFLFRKD